MTDETRTTEQWHAREDAANLAVNGPASRQASLTAAKFVQVLHEERTSMAGL
jgi:hypothetical protein